MPVTATISIVQIGNGYVVADSANDLYGGSEWRLAESTFYPSLDELCAAMPAFTKAAMEAAEQRAQDLRLAQEQAADGHGERASGCVGGTHLSPPGRVTPKPSQARQDRNPLR